MRLLPPPEVSRIVDQIAHTQRAPTKGGLFLSALVLITTAGSLTVHLILPVLPTLEDTFAIGPALAQATLSIAMLVMASGMLCYGSLSDRFGRRPVLLGGYSLLILGSAACTFATDIVMLLGGRLLQAAGAGVGVVIARAIVRDLYDLSASARPIAYLTVASVAAPMSAPAIGGGILDAFGWRATFGFAALVSLSVFLLALAALSETHTRRARYRRGGFLAGLRQLVRAPRFWGFALNGAMNTATWFAYASACSFLMQSVLQRPATEYGLYFLVITSGYMVGNMIVGRLGPRFRIETYLVFGTALSLAFLVAMGIAVALLPLTPLVLFLPGLAFVFAQGFAMPNSLAGAISVDRTLAGTASGAAGFLQMSLGALASEVVAALSDGTPWPMVWMAIGATILALVAGLVALRTAPRTA